MILLARPFVELALALAYALGAIALIGAGFVASIFIIAAISAAEVARAVWHELGGRGP